MEPLPPMPPPVGVTLYNLTPDELIRNENIVLPGNVLDPLTGQIIQVDGTLSGTIYDHRTNSYIWPLPISYYDLIPDGAVAIFSTSNGARPKRKPTPHTPGPVARSNFWGEAKAKAAELRRDFPHLMPYVTIPQEWRSLYNYFDGYDLWAETPRFLFYVLRFIAEMNDIVNKEIMQEKEAEIDSWAASWVAVNESMILRLPPNEDLVIMISNTPVWYEIWDMHSYEFKMLRFALNFHRHRLRDRYVNCYASPYRHSSAPVPRNSQYQFKITSYPNAGNDNPHSSYYLNSSMISSTSISNSYGQWESNGNSCGAPPYYMANTQNGQTWGNRSRACSGKTTASSLSQQRGNARYNDKRSDARVDARKDLNLWNPNGSRKTKNQSIDADKTSVYSGKQASIAIATPSSNPATKSAMCEVSGSKLKEDDTKSATEIEVQNDQKDEPTSPDCLSEIITGDKETNVVGDAAVASPSNLRFDGVAQITTQGSVTNVVYINNNKIANKKFTVYTSCVLYDYLMSHRLRDLLSQCGSVLSIKYSPNSNQQKSESNDFGVAYIEFDTLSAAQDAIKRFKSYKTPYGRILEVSRYHPSTERARTCRQSGEEVCVRDKRTTRPRSASVDSVPQVTPPEDSKDVLALDLAGKSSPIDENQSSKGSSAARTRTPSPMRGTVDNSTATTPEKLHIEHLQSRLNEAFLKLQRSASFGSNSSLSETNSDSTNREEMAKLMRDLAIVSASPPLSPSRFSGGSRTSSGSPELTEDNGKPKFNKFDPFQSRGLDITFEIKSALAEKKKTNESSTKHQEYQDKIRHESSVSTANAEKVGSTISDQLGMLFQKVRESRKDQASTTSSDSIVQKANEHNNLEESPDPIKVSSLTEDSSHSLNDMSASNQTKESAEKELEQTKIPAPNGLNNLSLGKLAKNVGRSVIVPVLPLEFECSRFATSKKKYAVKKAQGIYPVQNMSDSHIGKAKMSINSSITLETISKGPNKPLLTDNDNSKCGINTASPTPVEPEFNISSEEFIEVVNSTSSTKPSSSTFVESVPVKLCQQIVSTNALDKNLDKSISISKSMAIGEPAFTGSQKIENPFLTKEGVIYILFRENSCQDLVARRIEELEEESLLNDSVKPPHESQVDKIGTANDINLINHEAGKKISNAQDKIAKRKVNRKKKKTPGSQENLSGTEAVKVQEKSCENLGSNDLHMVNKQRTSNEKTHLSQAIAHPHPETMLGSALEVSSNIDDNSENKKRQNHRANTKKTADNETLSEKTDLQPTALDEQLSINNRSSIDRGSYKASHKKDIYRIESPPMIPPTKNHDESIVNEDLANAGILVNLIAQDAPQDVSASDTNSRRSENKDSGVETKPLCSEQPKKARFQKRKFSATKQLSAQGIMTRGSEIPKSKTTLQEKHSKADSDTKTHVAEAPLSMGPKQHKAKINAHDTKSEAMKMSMSNVHAKLETSKQIQPMSSERTRRTSSGNWSDGNRKRNSQAIAATLPKGELNHISQAVIKAIDEPAQNNDLNEKYDSKGSFRYRTRSSASSKSSSQPFKKENSARVSGEIELTSRSGGFRRNQRSTSDGEAKSKMQPISQQTPSPGSKTLDLKSSSALDDTSQWPALAPSRSPSSAIADGRPPQTPIIRPYNSPKKSSDTNVSPRSTPTKSN